jgi:hypothetical protein
MACGCGGAKPMTIKGLKSEIKSEAIRLTELEKFPNLYPASIAGAKTKLRSLRAKLAARRRKLQLVAA